MQLHYREQGEGKSIVFLHGLFGSLDNLNSLAKELKDNHQVIQVDLRNHGRSCWRDEMNYQLMAEDIANLLNTLNIKHTIIIGHSMGGKVAMALSKIIADKISQLIILDIAPTTYPTDKYQALLDILNAVTINHITERKNAAELMRSFHLNEHTLQFFLKSFCQGKWLFNLHSICCNIDHIAGWQPIHPFNKPVLFIKGQNSDYITPNNQQAILTQFPQAKMHIIANAGHNVHVEKPQQVLNAIQRFLVKLGKF